MVKLLFCKQLKKIYIKKTKLKRNYFSIMAVLALTTAVQKKTKIYKKYSFKFSCFFNPTLLHGKYNSFIYKNENFCRKLD